MSADPIIYCLERLTDYRQFERLCSDLMAGSGYPAIDPLGGTGDGGRDAIIWSAPEGKTIFAYTVREDWRKKLEHDCNRIKDENHKPERVVYVCTSALSASDKDKARQFVLDKFSWDLEIYDLERIRVLLVGPLKPLVAQHPGIFSPPFFPQRGGHSIAESRDTILIDHVPADSALATWLARRLALEGHLTWCVGTAPLAGENADDSVRTLLQNRAAQYLPIVSSAAVSDELFIERCAIAGTRDGLSLPCIATGGNLPALPSRLKSLVAANFHDSWATGLSDVLNRLKANGISPTLDRERGREIALREYLPQRVTMAKPEKVFANVFKVKVPSSMKVYEMRQALSQIDAIALRRQWAFCEVGTHAVFSFESAPAKLHSNLVSPRPAEFAWESFPERSGKKTFHAAIELIRRSLDVACVNAGLNYCTDRQLFYFPSKGDKDWVQPLEHVDGRRTRVSLTGTKTKGFGDRASMFNYQLSPIFKPRQDDSGQWWVTLQVYVRTTTLDGEVFEGKEIGRRRKVVTKSWWNQQWLARLLGVVQALRTDGHLIRVGTAHHAVEVDSNPMEWSCPVGLDYLALSGISDLGEEMAEVRTRDEDVEDEVVEVIQTPQGDK